MSYSKYVLQIYSSTLCLLFHSFLYLLMNIMYNHFSFMLCAFCVLIILTQANATLISKTFSCILHFWSIINLELIFCVCCEVEVNFVSTFVEAQLLGRIFFKKHCFIVPLSKIKCTHKHWSISRISVLFHYLFAQPYGNTTIS